MEFKTSGIFRKRSLRLGGEFFWVALGQGVAVLGSIVGVRLMTSVLTPEIYGELSLGMTVSMLAQQTVLSPISGAFLRFFAPAQEAKQLSGYLKGVRQLLSQATLLLIAVFAIISLGLWVFGHAKWLYLVVAALVFALVSGYNSSMDGIQNAARHRPVVALHQGLGQWLRFLMAVLLIYLLGMSSGLAMAGYGLAAVIVFISQWIFFRRGILPLIESVNMVANNIDIESPKRQMISYAWPFATWGIFTWAHFASDRWAIQIFSDTSDVGLYAALYQLGYYPIMILSGLMLQLLSPILFIQAGNGTNLVRINHARSLNNRLLVGSVILTIVGALLAFFLHTQIFNLLVAPEYCSVSLFLPLMVLAGGFFASGQVASLIPMTNVNTKSLILPKLLTALFGVLLNFTGAYLMGLKGVVFASIIFSIMYFFWMMCLVMQRVPNLKDFRQACNI